MTSDITPDDLLLAYRNGFFPMADQADSPEIYWYNPEKRGQLSIDALHVTDRLRRTALRVPYDIRIDSDFAGVIDGCAASAGGRESTWINIKIRELFMALHESGHAHSVECWKDGKLVGGLYGLSVGGAFCGESMFSRATDASKIALLHLCARLWKSGFTVLDTQFINPHLLQFGAHEIAKDQYLEKLHLALQTAPAFLPTLPANEEQALLKEYLQMLRAESA